MALTLPVSKKQKRLRKKALKKQSCSDYSDTEVDSNDKVTATTCKICTLYLPQIRVEARGRELHGVLALLVKYADDLDCSHKRNIDKQW